MPSAVKAKTKLPPSQQLSFLEEPRRERLALNLADVGRVPDSVRQMILAGKVDTERYIKTDPQRPDEAAVLFTCDLLSAACICDTLRQHDEKAGDPPTRVYVCRAQAWVRLPGDAVLTVVANGKVGLSPAVFPPPVAPVPPAKAVPPKAKAFRGAL